MFCLERLGTRLAVGSSATGRQYRASWRPQESRLAPAGLTADLETRRTARSHSSSDNADGSTIPIKGA